MKTTINPAQEQWKSLLQRPVINQALLTGKVKAILQEVRNNGDAAVKKFTLQFDKIDLTEIRVTDAEINAAIKTVPDSLKRAIEAAATNIRRFHESQTASENIIEVMKGIKCWRRSVAIGKVGFYIPGGTAPLFSTVLMLGIPASIAGCKEMVLCTPPSADNAVHPAILFAAQTSGIKNIFKAGGVQAIAAMAYGTETIPAVYKIFGPGNQYVNCAKQLIQLDGVAIDMPAGPSEVCVLADESCNPAFVAADLLSQAEHGEDSQVLLVCNSKTIGEQVLKEIEKQIKVLPRSSMAEKSLANSNVIVMENLEKAIALINEYAPEHLIICCRENETIANAITNAGSVFLGNYAPESAGDYASGTNHVLPTNGFAKTFSGVSVDSFVKKITFQQLTKEGLEAIGQSVEEMAAAEGLDAHKNAISIRLNKKG